jgi:hypothetical protein
MDRSRDIRNDSMDMEMMDSNMDTLDYSPLSCTKYRRN